MRLGTPQARLEERLVGICLKSFLRQMVEEKKKEYIGSILAVCSDKYTF